ncbi:uncharacterized protein LOC119099439 [Pollicipes pollicipes]|uniref:uncharacterized protein LOC119099090 n=1 Tax=Pollicipes pollicipes TaxID=41117 RepID=UPI001884F22E|nr:uncharacterized protein LOC119099090 [Pollicipes pollicipes]XP_037078491.1 uncharacterized protein LOC119099439 [Pollicipes pollicipes]
MEDGDRRQGGALGACLLTTLLLLLLASATSALSLQRAVREAGGSGWEDLQECGIDSICAFSVYDRDTLATKHFYPRCRCPPNAPCVEFYDNIATGVINCKCTVIA